MTPVLVLLIVIIRSSSGSHLFGRFVYICFLQHCPDFLSEERLIFVETCTLPRETLKIVVIQMAVVVVHATVDVASTCNIFDSVVGDNFGVSV